MELGVDINHLEGARHFDARLLGVHDLLSPVQNVRQLGAVRVGGTGGGAVVHTAISRGRGGVRGN